MMYDPKIIFSDLPPVNRSNIWLNSNDNTLYRFDKTKWIPLSTGSKSENSITDIDIKTLTKQLSSINNEVFDYASWQTPLLKPNNKILLYRHPECEFGWYSFNKENYLRVSRTCKSSGIIIDKHVLEMLRNDELNVLYIDCGKKDSIVRVNIRDKNEDVFISEAVRIQTRKGGAATLAPFNVDAIRDWLDFKNANLQDIAEISFKDDSGDNSKIRIYVNFTDYGNFVEGAPYKLFFDNKDKIWKAERLGQEKVYRIKKHFTDVCVTGGDIHRESYRPIQDVPITHVPIATNNHSPYYLLREYNDGKYTYPLFISEVRDFVKKFNTWWVYDYRGTSKYPRLSEVVKDGKRILYPRGSQFKRKHFNYRRISGINDVLQLRKTKNGNTLSKISIYNDWYNQNNFAKALRINFMPQNFGDKKRMWEENTSAFTKFKAINTNKKGAYTSNGIICTAYCECEFSSYWNIGECGYTLVRYNIDEIFPPPKQCF